MTGYQSKQGEVVAVNICYRKVEITFKIKINYFVSVYKKRSIIDLDEVLNEKQYLTIYVLL